MSCDVRRCRTSRHSTRWRAPRTRWHWAPGPRTRRSCAGSVPVRRWWRARAWTRRAIPRGSSPSPSPPPPPLPPTLSRWMLFPHLNGEIFQRRYEGWSECRQPILQRTTITRRRRRRREKRKEKREKRKKKSEKKRSRRKGAVRNRETVTYQITQKRERMQPHANADMRTRKEIEIPVTRTEPAPPSILPSAVSALRFECM